MALCKKRLEYCLYFIHFGEREIGLRIIPSRALGGIMKYIIRRALLGLFIVSVGCYAGFWSMKLLDLQLELGAETQSIDWKYGFGAMVLMAIATSSIALGVIINTPKLLRRLVDWSEKT